MDIPVVSMIVRAGWVARIVLMLLGVESILAWAIIFNRLYHLGGIRKLNRLFRSKFDSAATVPDIDKISEHEKAPFSLLAKTGAVEYRRIIEDARSHAGKDWAFFLQSQFSMAGDRLDSALSALSSKLDSGAFLLAIISSSAPFLGLLGTVWGIMDAFFEIGNQGSASLPVVAPGIAESLIATVVGLVVAIPAVFFYNVIIHRAQRIEDEMEEFREMLLSRIKREIFALLYGPRADKTTPRQTT